MKDRQLIYVADPMCSWCWGFSPVIDSIRYQFSDDLSVLILLGGLRPRTTEVMDEATKSMIREHWEHVQERTGQPFDFAFFDREGFIYDTEPPSRAVVAARSLNMDMAFAVFRNIQHAFYAENRDVTNSDTLYDLAAESGFDREKFAALYNSEEVKQKTLSDFAGARRAGVNGFPALIAGSESEGYEVITVGYRPLEQTESLILSWLK